MQKRIIFILFLLLFNNALYSQTEENLLKSLGESNGVHKLEILHDLQQQFLYESKDRYYNNLLLEEAQRQDNKSYIAIALTNRVAFHYRDFVSDSVFYYAKIAQDFDLKYNMKKDFLIVKKLIIQRYLEQGHYSLGLREAIEMNKAAQESRDIQMEASALEFLAKAYHALGRPSEAIGYLKRARNILIQSEEAPYKILGYYLFMSDLFEDKNNKDSLYVYADSLRISIRTVKEKYPTYNLKDYEIGNILNFISYYIQSNRLDEAQTQIETADSLISENETPFFVFAFNRKKMEYYYARKDFEKVEKYYYLNYEFSEKNRLERWIRYLLRFKAKALGEVGKHNEAVDSYRILESHVDSVNHQRFLYEINQLSMEFELDKKENRIKQQARELKLKTQLNFILRILVFFLVLVSIIIIRYLKIIRDKNRHLFEQIKELTETKIELIQFKESVRERVGGVITPYGDKDDQLFEKLENFMNKEKPYINSDYARKSLIADMNTNEVYLSRAIRKGINMTIQEYINSWRMEQAKHLLLQDMNMTIEAVAMDSGFSSIRNFYRLFKESYGMSPSEFRNYVKENYKT